MFTCGKKQENFPKNIFKPNPFLLSSSKTMNGHEACYAHLSIIISPFHHYQLILDYNNKPCLLKLKIYREKREIKH